MGDGMSVGPGVDRQVADRRGTSRAKRNAGYLLVSGFTLLCALSVPLAVGGAPAAAVTRWQSPVRPLAIVKDFDPPAHDWLSGHRGVDLRARPGQRVSAAGAGRVVYASALAGRGVVVVDHGALRTTYEPVAASVRRGDRVGSGSVLGRIAAGSGHCGDGHCLHFGVRRGATYLDPKFLLRGFRAVLRPLEPTAG